MPFYIFRLGKGHQLSTYVTGGGKEVIQNGLQLRTEGVTPHLYVHTYTISFQLFGCIFVLWCLDLFMKIKPYVYYSKKMCSSE